MKRLVLIKALRDDVDTATLVTTGNIKIYSKSNGYMKRDYPYFEAIKLCMDNDVKGRLRLTITKDNIKKFIHNLKEAITKGRSKHVKNHINKQLLVFFERIYKDWDSLPKDYFVDC